MSTDIISAATTPSTEATNTTTTATTTTTTQNSTVAATSTATATTDDHTGVIVGSVIGAVCAVVLIIIIIVLLYRRRCCTAGKKAIPVLPDPHARYVIDSGQHSNSGVPESPIDTSTAEVRRPVATAEVRRPVATAEVRIPVANAADNRYPDPEGLKYDSGSYVNPKQHTWKVQGRVIHSPDDSPEVPYFDMKDTHRISMSPPSPKSDHRIPLKSNNRRPPPALPTSISPPSTESADAIHQKSNDQRPPPAPCKSPVGYVNVHEKKSHSTTKASSEPTPLPHTTDEGTTSQDKLTEDEDEYEIIQNVHPTIKSFNPHDHIMKTGDIPGSSVGLFNVDISDSSLPELQRKSSCYENISIAELNNNGDLQNRLENHEDIISASENNVTDSSGNTQTQSSYVNVDKYKKTLPVKQETNKDLQETASTTKPTSDKPTSNKPTSETNNQTRSKPPATQPKPKLGHIKAANLTSSEDLSLMDGQNSSNNANNPGFRDIGVCYDKISDAENKSKHPTSRKLLAANLKQGENQNIINQNTGSSDAVGHGSPGSTSDDEDRVYQNMQELTNSDRKPSNTSSNQTDNVQSQVGRIKKNETNVQQELNGVTDRTKIVRQSDNPLGASRAHLQNTHFGSSPDVTSPGSILEEMKSKLKKVK